jgi:large subunit ribosomal protein L7/L12
MACTKEDVLEYISNLTVLELSELVKEFEEKFGVSAQATVVAAAPAQQPRRPKSRPNSTSF